MSYRARGGGRGRGGRIYAKEESFPLFPSGVELPDRGNVKGDMALLRWQGRMTNYWKYSPYLIEQKSSEKNEVVDIEKYSDRAKPKRRWMRESVSAFMKLERGYFPQELLEGVKSGGIKKAKWKQDSDGKKLDMIFDETLQKLKKKQNNKEATEGNESDKEDEDEEEDDQSSASTGGDYSQNEDFDDDEDDFNVADDNPDEADTY
ncbi:hypothetical protein Dimus_027658 [Dionaea muscipula]